MQKDDRKGETLFLIGGGPSLKKVDLEPLQKIQDRVIVCNNAYKLFPYAFNSHHADYIWWDWHKDVYFDIYKGPNPTTHGIGAGSRNAYPEQMRRFRKPDGKGGGQLSDNFPIVYGFCAGMHIINIAYILGASRLILLGYDLKAGAEGETQWHNEHQRETTTVHWTKTMLPEFDYVARHFEETGAVKVFNANPDSAIRGFEFCNDYRDFI